MTTTELKEKTTDFMEERITLSKLDFCLITAIGLFAGILIGMLLAPVTRGIHVSLFSHNGNNSANDNGNNCGSTINDGCNDCDCAVGADASEREQN